MRTLVVSKLTADPLVLALSKYTYRWSSFKKFGPMLLIQAHLCGQSTR